MEAQVTFSFLVDFRMMQKSWTEVDKQILSFVWGSFCDLSFELLGMWSCIYGQSEQKANGTLSYILQSYVLGIIFILIRVLPVISTIQTPLNKHALLIQQHQLKRMKEETSVKQLCLPLSDLRAQLMFGVRNPNMTWSRNQSISTCQYVYNKHHLIGVMQIMCVCWEAGVSITSKPPVNIKDRKFPRSAFLLYSLFFTVHPSYIAYHSFENKQK